MNNQANHNIKCSVSSCAHHCEQNCCTLNEIKVGCCGAAAPKSCDSTECASFQLRDQRPGCCKSRRPLRVHENPASPIGRKRAIFLVLPPLGAGASRPWGRKRPPLQASPQSEPRA